MSAPEVVAIVRDQISDGVYALGTFAVPSATDVFIGPVSVEEGADRAMVKQHVANAEFERPILQPIDDAALDGVLAKHDRFNRALIEYASRDECELIYTRETGWYVIDGNTYDGEALQLADTAMGALLAWYENEVEKAERRAAA